VEWDGRDRRGAPVSSGVYIARLDTGDAWAPIVETRRLIVLR
jgi:hypothetical protein